MAGPTLTRGLRNLQRQLSEHFPDRHLPDGWLGDRAHAARTSGHNPDDTPGSRPAWEDGDSHPDVRALDASADLGPGADPLDLVAHLTALPGLYTVIRYVIHAGLIFHARTGFDPRPYDGANGHYEHLHFEGAWSEGGDDNDTFDYHLEEIPVALTPADKKWISAEIAKVVAVDADPGPRAYSLGGLVTTVERRTVGLDQLPARLEAIAVDLSEIKAKLAA